MGCDLSYASNLAETDISLIRKLMQGTIKHLVKPAIYAVKNISIINLAYQPFSDLHPLADQQVAELSNKFSVLDGPVKTRPTVRTVPSQKHAYIILTPL